LSLRLFLGYIFCIGIDTKVQKVISTKAYLQSALGHIHVHQKKLSLYFLIRKQVGVFQCHWLKSGQMSGDEFFLNWIYIHAEW
jgi:hypothetical protein